MEKSDIPLRFGILTVSDRSSQGIRPDVSGPELTNAVRQRGWNILRTGIVPDDVTDIQRVLAEWADSGDVDIILTTGGTGFSPRDITPEATQGIIERSVPGIGEAMRLTSLRITPHAMLSRGIAGIRRQTLIVNLPGSPKAALENLDVILPVLPHAVELLREYPGSEAGHQLKN
jgi:molybdenum cofactor synthesis domain-containing protein